MLLKGNPNLLYRSTLLLSLIVLLVSSWNAPMSGDEYVHVKQAELNINYIATFGQDNEALNTPISRLKHYGQSFDTITTYIAQIFEIDELYRFRHISNASLAWLTILFASLVTFKITKSKIAAFITIVLFLISLRYMGHATNNLKDIPFALAFIFSLFYLFRFLEKMPKISWIDLALMTLGLAFGISIRIGGLLILAYFLLFTGLFLYYLFVSGNLQAKPILKISWKIGALFIGVFCLAYFCAILIWPWALEHPMSNPWISLELMHQYPTTIRQIFEGKLYWSDRFPWYYLFKYLLITLPVILLIGFGASFYFIWKLKESKSIIFSLFLLITFGFPLFYAATSGANVYGGWRQMLFVFPPLVVLSSLGLWKIWEQLKRNLILKIAGIIAAAILLYGPVRYFVANYPYQYTFFNQLVGGATGAYGNYELDYYFTSFQKAYEFIDQLEDQPKIVAANFIIPQYYKGKFYKAALVDFYDRSSVDWDYAIICNTFLDPDQLRYWPPQNTVFTQKIDGRNILAVLKRETKDDFEGITLLKRKQVNEAIFKLTKSLEHDPNNISILLNLARAYVLKGDEIEIYNYLSLIEQIYPSNEWAKEIRGEMQLEKGNIEKAIELFKDNVDYNYKFFHSYVNLAKAYISHGNEKEAIRQLKTCLRINPFYKPAYNLYGKLLIEQGDVELGQKMLEYTVEGDGKYRGK